LKERLEEQEGEEEDVSRCWMTLRKQEDTGSWRKLRIALFGELSLEEAMDLSQDRPLLDLNNKGVFLLELWEVESILGPRGTVVMY
jgi:hypothetical protein